MHKTVKRATVVLAMTPLGLLPALAASAATLGPATSTAVSTTTSTVTNAVGATTGSSGSSTTSTVTTTTTDAPSSSASAAAAKVDGVIGISDTSASSGKDKDEAHAHALDVLGTTVSGGDASAASGKQSSDGALLATPDNPIGDLEILPWSAAVTHDNGGAQAAAEASLAHAGLLDVLQVWLLHSQSNTTWTPGESTGASSSDGAEANVAGQLDVKVLHAEASSDGKGSSALLVINGEEIISSDDANGTCAIDADPLASILCLQASGGKGSATATVASLTSAATGITGSVSDASSQGGRVASPQTTSLHRSRQPQNGPLPHTSGPATGRLPFTGSPTTVLVAIGALFAAAGSYLVELTRRRRTPA